MTTKITQDSDPTRHAALLAEWHRDHEPAFVMFGQQHYMVIQSAETNLIEFLLVEDNTLYSSRSFS